MLPQLKSYNLIYLATPYSRFTRGLEMAFREAAILSAKLIKCGLPVYSPIVQMHPIAIYGDLPPTDHSLWLEYDSAMMNKSEALLVARMDGWDESFGIAEEIKFFKSAGKSIYHLDPDKLELI